MSFGGKTTSFALESSLSAEPTVVEVQDGFVGRADALYAWRGVTLGMSEAATRIH